MIHVLPVNDLKEHQESVHCHCQPRVDWDDKIVVHNSYDKREIVEQANEFLGGADASTGNICYVAADGDKQMFPECDRYGTPKSKMPDCPNCGEDELGMLGQVVFCYRCCREWLKAT